MLLRKLPCLALLMLINCHSEKDEIFIHAIKTGDKLTVINMLEEGQDPNTIYPSPPIIERVKGKYSIGESVLFLAIDEGHTEIAILLLDKGSNSNAITPYGKTPLFKAAQKDNIDVAKILIEKGANLRALDRNESSILHAAAFAKGNKCLRLFLNKDKTYINHKNKFGKTPSMNAQEGENVEGMKILVENGAVLPKKSSGREKTDAPKKGI